MIITFIDKDKNYYDNSLQYFHSSMKQRERINSDKSSQVQNIKMDKQNVKALVIEGRISYIK